MTTSGPSNSSYVEKAVDLALSIHKRDIEERESKERESRRKGGRSGEDDDDNKLGHILVFLTGQEEIERACRLLRTAIAEDPDLALWHDQGSSSSSVPSAWVLPLFGTLPNQVSPSHIIIIIFFFLCFIPGATTSIHESAFSRSQDHLLNEHCRNIRFLPHHFSLFPYHHHLTSYCLLY